MSKTMQLTCHKKHKSKKKNICKCGEMIDLQNTLEGEMKNNNQINPFGYQGQNSRIGTNV
jgi:hypothetical protein